MYKTNFLAFLLHFCNNGRVNFLSMNSLKIFISLVSLATLFSNPTLIAVAKTEDISSHVDILYLGKKFDKQSGREVEGYKFIHHKNGEAKNAANARKPGGTSCFSYFASGAKWKTVEPWIMNAENSRGLDEATLFNIEDAALSKWEDAADGVVGNGTSVQIFGAGSTTMTTLVADEASPDGANEVLFGDAGGASTIAVTIVWGVFSGPSQFRYLAEWDQIYDDHAFDWSLTGETSKMDFDNIATHENGHAAGMGHPSTSCVEETMYAYATEGETKKRTLNTGDITGINNLY